MMRPSAIFLAVILCCGCSPAADEERAAEETVDVARLNGIDYVGTLAKAKSGDAQALRTLIDFSDKVDAAAALGHGVELVDLAVALSDARFAAAVRDEPDVRRQMMAQLFEAGFDYHLEYAYGDFPKVLPATYAALSARGSTTPPSPSTR